MRIGIDIDDTIVYTNKVLKNEAKKYNAKILNNRKIKNHNSKLVEDKYDWTVAEKIDFLKYCVNKYYMNLEIKKDSKEIINKLFNEGHEIYIVTYRTNECFGNAYDFCYTWLTNNDIKFTKLIVNRGDKGNVCKEENIDLFIDDRLENCIDAIKNGSKAILFDENKFYDTDLISVITWKEVEKIIGEMING